MLKIEKTEFEIKMYWTNDRMESAIRTITDDVKVLLDDYTNTKILNNSIIFNIIGINSIKGMKTKVFNDLKIAEEILGDKFLDDKYPVYDINEIKVEKIKSVKKSIGTYTGRSEEFNGVLYVNKGMERSFIYYHISDDSYSLCLINGDTLIVSCITKQKEIDDLVKIEESTVETFDSVDNLIRTLRGNDIY